MQKNKTFQIFTGIAILLVVCGHIDLQIFSIGQLFPYYSFHVMMFVFVSGYFFQEKDLLKPFDFLKRKVMHLLLPYFCWNLFYGILVSLLHQFGFLFGSNLSLRSLLLDPFLNGHQFMLNYPAWFVPALFVIHCCNFAGRWLLRHLGKCMPFLNTVLNHNMIIFLITLLCGTTTVYLAIGGHVWGLYKFPGRILFMLPIYEFGILCKERTEKLQKVPAWCMITIAVLIQLLLQRFCGGLAFSAVWCTSFGNGPVIPYLTSITGILFWYGISRVLAEITFIDKVFAYIGDCSFSIMMHHVLGFFLVNSLFYLLKSRCNILAMFDNDSYFNMADYYYLPANYFKVIYLIAGLSIAILLFNLQKALRAIRKK